MTEQKMYYYEKGVLKLETEIVTGNMRRRMGTPEGVNFVYNKQKIVSYGDRGMHLL